MASGDVCGAYALRGLELCYWHHKARESRAERKKAVQRQKRKPSGIVLPLLEDANSVQLAIQMVAQAVADRRISRSEAGSLLYACQLAIMNLRSMVGQEKIVNLQVRVAPETGDEDLVAPYEIPEDEDPEFNDGPEEDDEEVDEEEVESAERFVLENRSRLKALGVEILTG